MAGHGIFRMVHGEAGDAFWEAGEAGINMRQGAKQVSLGAELSVLQKTSMFCCKKKATV